MPTPKEQSEVQVDAALGAVEERSDELVFGEVTLEILIEATGLRGRYIREAPFNSSL